MNFSSRSTLQIFVLILVITGIMILALGGFISPVSNLVLAPIVKIQTWVTGRYIAVRTMFSTPEDLAKLRQTNAELLEENSRLKIQIIELQQQVTEAQVLSTLVDYARTRSENQYIAASVIGFDTNPFLRYVIINRGSDDGLRRGMPVVTNQGLVGQIDAVTARAARVQLIIDLSSVVNVHLQQANEDSLLKGQLNGDLVLENVPQSANVQLGDLIITSGLGGNYPPNLVVGQVTSVRKRDFDLFQSTSVQPAVDFRQLEIVLIIINFQPVNISPLIPQSRSP